MISRELESWKIKFFDDVIMMKIFESLIASPKSANQISYECDVPIATVYRKLKILEENELIEISGMINDAGDRIKLYKKKIK